MPLYVVAPGHRVRRPGSRERIPEGSEVCLGEKDAARLIAEGVLLAPVPPSKASGPNEAAQLGSPLSSSADGGTDAPSPLDVECPHCGAAVGESCLTASGAKRSPHKARIAASALEA